MFAATAPFDRPDAPCCMALAPVGPVMALAPVGTDAGVSCPILCHARLGALRLTGGRRD